MTNLKIKQCTHIMFLSLNPQLHQFSLHDLFSAKTDNIELLNRFIYTRLWYITFLLKIKAEVLLSTWYV
jgi:hypothetical protein